METGYYNSQSGCKEGDRVLASNADLEGKEVLLVKIANDSGTPEFALPSAQNDLAVFVLLDGATAAGDDVNARPLDGDTNVRVKLNGTCSPGAQLVLDVGASADYGKVKALPSTAGRYLQLGIAEEAGVDEQWVLMRPCVQFVHVESANDPQLTDNSGGTAADTIAAIGASYSQTEVANAVASLAAKVNTLLTLVKTHDFMVAD